MEKLKMTQEQKELLEQYFGIGDYEDCLELETWTEGGVNMFVNIDMTREETLVEQFEEYVNNFDAGEQVDTHRQDHRYRNAFSIRESINDFDDYLEKLKDILKELKELEV